MTDTPPTAAPADWYPDPAFPSRQRWWSGEAWTPLCAIAAIVLGIIGLSSARRRGSRRATSIIGIVLGAVGLVIQIVVVALVVAPILDGPRLDVPRLEQSLAAGVEEQTNEHVTVACPQDPPVAADATFECIATDQYGATRRIEVVVQDDSGSVTWRIVR